MYQIDQGHLTVFCIVFVWLGGPPSPVRIIAQVQWFMYQNRLEPSGGIYHLYKRNRLLWLRVNSTWMCLIYLELCKEVVPLNLPQDSAYFWRRKITLKLTLNQLFFIILKKYVKKTWGSFMISDQSWTLIWMNNLKFKSWINSNTYLVRESGGGIQRVAIWIYYKFAFLRTQNCISCSTSKYLFVHFLYYINFATSRKKSAGERGEALLPKRSPTSKRFSCL